MAVKLNCTLGPQVMADPWFQTDLPEGALTMNQWYMENVDSLDDVSLILLCSNTCVYCVK